MARISEWSGIAVYSLIFLGAAVAQPGPVPSPLINTPCDANPGNPTDTVVSAPDSAGFRFIFDGRTFKGWWENCQTPSSAGDRTLGGIWMIDTNLRAIFSTAPPNGVGDILMYNRQFTNTELIMDMWVDWGNDAGVFERTAIGGKGYQVGIDYRTGSSVGGSYGETGYAAFNIDPYLFAGNDSTINTAAAWTSLTAAQNPASYGCPATGCTPAQWTTVWNRNGWNQIRIEFFGNPPRCRTYIRRLGAAAWVPVMDHQSPDASQPTGYLGLQVHDGTAMWTGLAGNFYRNIKIRPLDVNGVPIPQIPVSLTPLENEPFLPGLHSPVRRDLLGRQQKQNHRGRHQQIKAGIQTRQ